MVHLTSSRLCSTIRFNALTSSMARRLLERCRALEPPNVGAYNVLVSALARASDFTEARFVVQHEMPQHKVDPNVVTHNALLNEFDVVVEPYATIEIGDERWMSSVLPISSSSTRWSTLRRAAVHVSCSMRCLVKYTRRTSPTWLLSSSIIGAFVSPTVRTKWWSCSSFDNAKNSCIYRAS